MEVFPPKKDTDFEMVKEAALHIASLKPSFMSVTYGAGGSTKGNTIKLASEIQMAQRQQKFIKGLEAALVRIQNKTYGIDRETGELIPKERLRAVPHATLSVASKEARKK